MPAKQTQKKPKVIILGAGLAGLTAAYELKKKHYIVTILEARDRIGGRVDTKLLSGDPTLTIEMGGEWIGKSHHHIRSLCRELRLSLMDHRLALSLLYDGKFFGPRQWTFSTRWKHKLRRLMKETAKLSLAEAKQLDAIDWWHYLVANHVPKRDLEIIDLVGGTDAGEDIRFISALNALADALSDHDCYRIKGGNWLLPQALAKRIGEEHIHLRHKVTAVRQTDDSVFVECSNGLSYAGDMLICTLPASVAASIRWIPHLPSDKQTAFAALNYCRIMKVSLLFSRRFWRDSFEVATDTLADFIYHSTQNQPGGKGVLTAYAVGDRAYILSNMSDPEKIETICRTLEVPFGDVRGLVESITSYYWGDDPYVGGAYALFEKNHPLDLKAVLRSPVQRCYFAGEHTADSQGFMEGAVESGLRAVKHLSEAIGKD